MFRTALLANVVTFCAVSGQAQSQDPIPQLLTNFYQIDVNGDGVISYAEFRRVQAARWPQIDRNGDGYLSEDDFPTAAARRAKTQLAEIAHLDVDGDDRISQSEFLNGPASVFTQADRNSDGALTRAEVDAPSF